MKINKKITLTTLIGGVVLFSSPIALAGGHIEHKKGHDMKGEHSHHEMKKDKHHMKHKMKKEMHKKYMMMKTPFEYDYVEMGYLQRDAEGSAEGLSDDSIGYYGVLSKQLNPDVFAQISYKSAEDEGDDYPFDTNLSNSEKIDLKAGYIFDMSDKVDGKMALTPTVRLGKHRLIMDDAYSQAINKSTISKNVYALGVNAQYQPKHFKKLSLSAGYEFQDTFTDEDFNGEDVLSSANIYSLGAQYKVNRDISVTANYDIVDAEKPDLLPSDLNGDTLRVGLRFDY